MGNDVYVKAEKLLNTYQEFSIVLFIEKFEDLIREDYDYDEELRASS